MARRTLSALVLLILCAHRVDGQSGRDAGKRTRDAGQQTGDAGQQTKALNLSAYAELLRSDVRAQKVAIITEVMGFTESEDAAFWPIYREYDLEMATLGDERTALIAEYANNYANLTDAVAERLATRALDLEARRQAAKQKCYERVKTALSPRTALRFLQVEHQLLLLIDLQISALLPVAPTTRGTDGKR
jgi:hypothetical protein